MKLSPKGQSLTEYALIFSVVLAALIAMQTYVKRGLQGRYREATDTVVSGLRQATGNSTLPLQYEPYYRESEISATSNRNKVEQVNLGGSKKTTIDNTSTKEPGSYQQILPVPVEVE